MFSNIAYAEMVQIPIHQVTDNEAANYFFSLVFYLFLFLAPTKIALQILWDYASHRKGK
jgi:hypothetical protein